MIGSLRLVLLACVLATVTVTVVNTVADAASVSDISRYANPAEEHLVRYRQQPMWWQSGLFPRWNDTYVIVFEQEMLA